jgi:hypothetical protein
MAEKICGGLYQISRRAEIKAQVLTWRYILAESE